MSDAPQEFDADTRLRMWTITVAMQSRSPNQSFDGAVRNAATLFEYLKSGGFPVEGERPHIIKGKVSDLSVV